MPVCRRTDGFAVLLVARGDELLVKVLAMPHVVSLVWQNTLDPTPAVSGIDQALRLKELRRYPDSHVPTRRRNDG